MDNLSSLIKKFSDREFAFFYAYRYPKFSRISKKIIDSERISRMLDKSKIDKIVHKKFEVEEEHCPRCNFRKHFIESEIEWRRVGYDQMEVEKQSNFCMVCGYDPSRAKAISLRVWINKFLGKYSWFRTKK